MARGWCLGFVAAAVLAAGCGRGLPETARVSGRVTLDGNPVTSGTIQFWPAAGRPARGTIQPDGTYTLATFDDKDGAVLGRHTVTVESTRIQNPGPEIKSTEEEIAYYSKTGVQRIVAGTVERLVPERYSNRDLSGLSAEVRRGDNQIDFPLQSGGLPKPP